jgi:hypothetical protein
MPPLVPCRLLSFGLGRRLSQRRTMGCSADLYVFLPEQTFPLRS